jgi:hypothetical protein
MALKDRLLLTSFADRLEVKSRIACDVSKKKAGPLAAPTNGEWNRPVPGLEHTLKNHEELT